MSDVAIIGAGEIGGTLAHLLASRDLASVVHLIDDAGRVAEGKALDIAQSAPVASFSTRVSGSAEIAAAAGASLVFVADRINGGEWQGEDAMVLLRRLARTRGAGAIVCAGASHRELVERGAREAGIDRRRLFGSAPEALASAIRSMAALETGGSPRDIALTVMGVPPADVVVPWEESSVAGVAAASVLEEPARRRLMSRVGALWPPGPHALAAAALKAAAAILGRSRHTVTVFVAPDDSSGRRMRAAAWPVRLGPEGIVRFEAPTLTTHDRVALDNAMLL